MGNRSIKYRKKGLATVLALVICCMNTFTVLASDQDPSEIMETLAYESCWNCGNYSFYEDVEYGPWVVYYQVPCTHGLAFDKMESRAVYSVIKCTYCQYTIEKIYIREDYKDLYCSPN